MKVFAYYLRTESGDEVLKMSHNNYKNAVDFMKNEVSHEYKSWVDEDYEDEDIPYAEFLKKEMEVESGIEKCEKIKENAYGCHDWEFINTDDGVDVYDVEQGDMIGRIDINYTMEDVINEVNNKTYAQVRNWIQSVIDYF